MNCRLSNACQKLHKMHSIIQQLNFLFYYVSFLRILSAVTHFINVHYNGDIWIVCDLLLLRKKRFRLIKLEKSKCLSQLTHQQLRLISWRHINLNRFDFSLSISSILQLSHTIYYDFTTVEFCCQSRQWSVKWNVLDLSIFRMTL